MIKNNQEDYEQDVEDDEQDEVEDAKKMKLKNKMMMSSGFDDIKNNIKKNYLYIKILY